MLRRDLVQDWFRELGLPFIEPAARSEMALKQILGRRSVA